MLVVSTLLAEGIATGFGYNMIIDLINSSLKNEVSADAGLVNRELNSTFYYLNGIADSVEQLSFADDSEIMNYLIQTVGRYDMIPTGAYLALNDGSFFYPSEPSFKMDGITEKPWYIEAMGYDNSFLTGTEAFLQEEDGVVKKVRAGGTRYYMVSSTVDGTDWQVIAYAKVTEVLATLYKIMIILVVFVMIRVLSNMIKKPITAITENIEKIANGDFTI